MVYDGIFTQLEESIDFSESKGAKEQITRWYRHSISGSLKIQQPNTEIFVFAEDKNAKEAAKQYFPGHKVNEIDEDRGILEQSVCKCQSNIIFASKDNIDRLRTKKERDTEVIASVSTFNPFPDYSPNDLEGAGNVVAVGMVDRNKLVGADKFKSALFLPEGEKGRYFA